MHALVAGNDLGNFAKIPAGGPEQLADEGKALLQRFVGAFIDFRKPLITAVNGPSIGIASACSLPLIEAHA